MSFNFAGSVYDGPWTALVTTAPDASHGTPIGHGDWRLSIEAALVTDAATMLVGTMEVGTAQVADYEWVDLTGYVRGLTWRQGADEFNGRPRPGVGTLTLSSPNGELSAWNTNGLAGRGGFLEAGLLMRWGLRSATDTRAGGWLPLFCGHVESWPSAIAGLVADEWVTVTVVETVAVLARVNDNALTGADLASAGAIGPNYLRTGSLLSRAGWKYGGIARWDAGETGPFLQQTDMAQNRLAECYLTADSSLAVFRSARTGQAELLADPFSGGVYYTPDPRVLWEFTNLGGDAFLTSDPSADAWDATIVPEEIVWANDDEALLNQSTVSVANTGVTVTQSDPASIRRYNGVRSTSRADLITVDDDANTVAYAITDLVSITARMTRRCDSVTLNSLLDPAGVLIQAAIDWADGVLIADYRPAPGYRMLAGGRVNALEHSITPLTGRVDWRTRLDLVTLDTDLQEV